MKKQFISLLALMFVPAACMATSCDDAKAALAAGHPDPKETVKCAQEVKEQFQKLREVFAYAGRGHSEKISALDGAIKLLQDAASGPLARAMGETLKVLNEVGADHSKILSAPMPNGVIVSYEKAKGGFTPLITALEGLKAQLSGEHVEGLVAKIEDLDSQLQAAREKVARTLDQARKRMMAWNDKLRGWLQKNETLKAELMQARESLQSSLAVAIKSAEQEKLIEWLRSKVGSLSHELEDETAREKQLRGHLKELNEKVVELKRREKAPVLITEPARKKRGGKPGSAAKQADELQIALQAKAQEVEKLLAANEVLRNELATSAPLKPAEAVAGGKESTEAELARLAEVPAERKW